MKRGVKVAVISFVVIVVVLIVLLLLNLSKPICGTPFYVRGVNSGQCELKVGCSLPKGFVEDDYCKRLFTADSEVHVAKLVEIEGGNYVPSAGYYEGSIVLTDIINGNNYSLSPCTKNWSWINKGSCYLYNQSYAIANTNEWSMELSGCFLGELNSTACVN